MTENELTESGESTTPPAPPDADRSVAKMLKRAAPYAAGIVAFFFGLLFFAPLESYAFLALRQLGSGGFHIDIGELSLSSFGRFRAQSLKLPLSGDSEKGGVLKIAEIKGKISLWGALTGDKFDSEAEAVILAFSKGDFSLKIDSLAITSALEQVKSGGTGKLINGTISLEAESAQVKYQENKFLKEEIVIPFLKIILKLRAQQNNFAIESGEALGRFVNAQIKGSFNMGAQTELNLNIILKPTNELFEKYQDKDLRTLLKFGGILQDDGRIEFNVRGTLNQPVVEAVKAVQPGAGTPPLVPPTP